jgi:tetratricopeptide (TPR) repeat protein
MRRQALAVAAGVICVLLAGAVMPPGGARASAEDVMEKLADCQDDEIDNEERAHLCTRLIEDTSLSEELRAEALVNRGIVHLEEDRLEAAIADFEQAIAFNPSYPAAHAYRGETHKAMGKLDKALADYDTAISLFTESADLYANRGDIHRLMGSFDKARGDFEAALKLEQGHEPASAGLKVLPEKK